jgi:hypothetical protein
MGRFYTERDVKTSTCFLLLAPQAKRALKEGLTTFRECGLEMDVPTHHPLPAPVLITVPRHVRLTPSSQPASLSLCPRSCWLIRLRTRWKLLLRSPPCPCRLLSSLHLCQMCCPLLLLSSCLSSPAPCPPQWWPLLRVCPLRWPHSFHQLTRHCPLGL